MSFFIIAVVFLKYLLTLLIYAITSFNSNSICYLNTEIISYKRNCLAAMRTRVFVLQASLQTWLTGPFSARASNHKRALIKIAATGQAQRSLLQKAASLRRCG